MQSKRKLRQSMRVKRFLEWWICAAAVCLLCMPLCAQTPASRTSGVHGEMLGGIHGRQEYESAGQLVGIAGRMNAALPMFSGGGPVLSLTTSGRCTSMPTITISAPQNVFDGSQAHADGYCIDGQIRSEVTFPGGGYSSASCSVSGGGVSSSRCAVNLIKGAGAADPRGINDSTAAIQNTIDYAFTHAVDRKDGVAAVYIPQGDYKINHRIMIPCDMWLRGDGQSSTIFDITDTSEDGFDVTAYNRHPNAWDCRGGIKGVEIYASQGAKYTASELTDLGNAGYTMENLTVSGGGGRGIVVYGGSERTFMRNIEIDTVRWPLILWGNENHLIKLNIASPGSADTMVREPDGTQGYYCFGTGSCVGGQHPSWNWHGGVLESASANGSSATFYVHSNSSKYPDSPIVAGMRFAVAGTTGADLDGSYIATSVRNGVTSDPSGRCNSSHRCFEVQADTTARGRAALVPPVTTASFARGAYVVKLASTEGFSQWESVHGPGIPSGTRIEYVKGRQLTLTNATSAAETNATLTGSPAWYPEVAPDKNSAVLFGSASGQIMDGSIKALRHANCITTVVTFGSSISHIYCEGFPPSDGAPSLNSTFRYGGYPFYTRLTSSLGGQAGSYTAVKVASTEWFSNYVNTLAKAYPAKYGGLGALMMIAPRDYQHGSTAPSSYVRGVERGQYEIVWGVFVGKDQFVVVSRNQSGSTAPAGTTWPAGSYLADRPATDGTGYGPMEISNMHANTIDSPGKNWAAYCNDQSTHGNVCGEFIVGNLINEIGSYSTGQAGAQAGSGGANVVLMANERWGVMDPGTELVGEGFVKTVGRGGSVEQLGGSGNGTGYGYESVNGDLYNDGYINVRSFDGSVPYASYFSDNGTFYRTGLATQGEPASGVTAIDTAQSNGPGSPSGAQIGMQFQSSYCFWDTSQRVGGHAKARWCFVGGPLNAHPHFEMDTWNAATKRWQNAFSLGEGRGGYNGTIEPSKPGCKLTVSGGVITGARGC